MSHKYHPNYPILSVYSYEWAIVIWIPILPIMFIMLIIMLITGIMTIMTIMLTNVNS